MSDTLVTYFEALDRLKKGRPTIVPRGTKITNDAVALEAGRGKGSIKKSRPAFRCLIDAILKAATEQFQPKDDARDRLESARNESKKYRMLWEEAIEREVSLLHELYLLKKQRGGNVIGLRGGNEK
jgi:hypothetical protein